MPPDAEPRGLVVSDVGQSFRDRPRILDAHADHEHVAGSLVRHRFCDQQVLDARHEVE
jgi:hypothetical protein